MENVLGGEKNEINWYLNIYLVTCISAWWKLSLEKEEEEAKRDFPILSAVSARVVEYSSTY